MPYINVNLSKTLTPQQETDLKAGIGGIVNLLPGKSEAVLMLDIESGKSFYQGGEKLDNAAFVDVRLWGHILFDDKAAFTKAMYKLFAEQLGTPENQLILNYVEFNDWATRGELRHR